MITLLVFFYASLYRIVSPWSRCILWSEKLTLFNFKIVTQLSTMKFHHTKKLLYKVVWQPRKYNRHISFLMFHRTKLCPHDQRCMLWRETMIPFNFKIITQLSTMKLHHATKSLYKVVWLPRKYYHHISFLMFHFTNLLATRLSTIVIFLC